VKKFNNQKVLDKIINCFNKITESKNFKKCGILSKNKFRRSFLFLLSRDEKNFLAEEEKLRKQKILLNLKLR